MDAPIRYEAVVKINLADNLIKQTRDISEGIGYAVALLMDEYGWTADQVGDLLERAQDDAHDNEARRG